MRFTFFSTSILTNPVVRFPQPLDAPSAYIVNVLTYIVNASAYIVNVSAYIVSVSGYIVNVSAYIAIEQDYTRCQAPAWQCGVGSSCFQWRLGRSFHNHAI
ncbi:MAG TPA: hypothetical protein V6C78_26285 [Crinalium sp.]